MGCSNSVSTAAPAIPSSPNKLESPPAQTSYLKRSESTHFVEAHLTKVEGVPLGFSFMSESKDEPIVITSIGKESGLQEWNRTHPGAEVLPGDTIVSVNGVEGEFWTVAAEAWKPGKVSIVVQKATPCHKCTLRRSASRVYLKEAGRYSHEPLHGPLDGLQHMSAGEYSGSTTECAICLEDFDAEERVVKLPCGHIFHMNCAASWLGRGQSQNQGGHCPLCRAAPGS
mmetsp:Transcript_35679/g.83506  ORF Transcript_35679/g.83506 Transcript_35679/m.83506 type:complete len:227 (+) Transcript_35679:115-795(+)